MKRRSIAFYPFLILSWLAGTALGQSPDSAEKPESKYQASTSQIIEPGVGKPDENKMFLAVVTDGYPHLAREKALEEVQFQARHKGLDYEICGREEEKLGLGYRVKIHYRLKPKTAEANPVKSAVLQEAMKGAESYLPALKKAWAEFQALMESYLGKNPTVDPANEP